jgi:amino-acid N-acetyltransferase
MESRIIDNQQSLNEVLSLLQNSKLPFQDIELKNNQFLSYHDAHGKIIGSGGLEYHGSYALVRSVAVAETERGKAIGQAIVKDLLDRAKQKPVKEAYLLTETAHDFFLKRGFADVTRENVPTEIQSSSEFKSVCPVSAACMVYKF